MYMVGSFLVGNPTLRGQNTIGCIHTTIVVERRSVHILGLYIFPFERRYNAVSFDVRFPPICPGSPNSWS